MVLVVKVDATWTPAKLSLLSPEGVLLSPDQVVYWERIRAIESSLREYFSVDLANFWVGKLQEISSLALERDNPSALDVDALSTLEKEAAREGVKVRNTLLSSKLVSLLQLGLVAACVVILWIFMVEYLSFIEGIASKFATVVIDAVNLFGALGFGVVGTCAGAALKAVISSRVVGFDTLHVLSNYNYPRLIYLLLLFGVFGGALFCLSLGLFDIVLGDTSLAGSLSFPPSAFILGVVCGFSETTIASRISTSVEGAASTGV
jgi:hypothetical protein